MDASKLHRGRPRTPSPNPRARTLSSFADLHPEREDMEDNRTDQERESRNERRNTRDDANLNGTLPSMYRAQSTVEDRMRRKLKFHFMNPWQKWKAKRKFPFKMILQIIKVVLVTVQLYMFGIYRSSHVTFVEKSNIAFKHLYLLDWDPAYETLPYPPATGQYAIYTIPKFYESVTYAQSRYNLTEDLAIGTYHFTDAHDEKDNVTLCYSHYKMGKIFAFNSTYYYDKDEVTNCIDLGTVSVYNKTTQQYEDVYDAEKFLKGQNVTINFDSLIKVELLMSVKTVHLKSLTKTNLPDCFQFDITITFKNRNHNGQILITLNAVETPLKCHGHITFSSDSSVLVVLTSVFDFLVIIVCFVSLMLTCRSLIRGQMTRREAEKFFKEHLGKKMDKNDKLEFIDLWYVLIVINDVLTIVGSVHKILIENNVEESYDICAVTLGTGALLVWFGVLRYLSFFEKYNVLILTLKRALPNVLRFLVCAGILYLGFLFCGWLVLGPYHVKFRELSSTSEAIFSLINGDDMYVTFSIINNINSYIWWYSRLYLYLFISLFIYVVLSVFISVIMDAYETIKSYYEHGFPKSDLYEFIEECQDGPNSPLYMSDDQEVEQTGTFSNLNCCGNCLKRSPSVPIIVEDSSSDESTHLLSGNRVTVNT